MGLTTVVANGPRFLKLSGCITRRLFGSGKVDRCAGSSLFGNEPVAGLDATGATNVARRSPNPGNSLKGPNRRAHHRKGSPSGSHLDDRIRPQGNLLFIRQVVSNVKPTPRIALLGYRCHRRRYHRCRPHASRSSNRHGSNSGLHPWRRVPPDLMRYR